MTHEVWVAAMILTTFSRRILAAGGFAVAIALLPLALSVIDSHTRRQAQDEMDAIATDFGNRAEAAINDGMRTLDELSSKGIAACGAREIELMQRSIYAEYWVMEVGLTSPDGSFVCNHLGDEMFVGLRSQIHSLDDHTSLRLVEIGDQNLPGIMLARRQSDSPILAVVIPSDVITMALTTGPITTALSGALRFSDGAIIGRLSRSTARVPVAADGEIVSASAASNLYPIVVELDVPLDVFRQRNEDLRIYALISSVLVGLTILALSIYAIRGGPAAISRLYDGAAREEFIPYYQPVVDLKTSRLVGCEVLMRWRKPNGTIVPPSEFIQLAEATGLAAHMTRSLMRQVRRDLEEIFGDRPHLKIGINLFDAHFDDPRTVRDIERIFAGSRIAFRQLMFELTERRPLKDVERARKVIAQFRSIGASVALDDAGTGHASLARLQQLGINVVKIDRMFIDTLQPGQRSAPIVDSLIKLGHDLGMEVIAEGVETVAQLEYLIDRGVDSAQGYLFSPPLPASAFIGLVGAVAPLRQSPALDRGRQGRIWRAPRAA